MPYDNDVLNQVMTKQSENTQDNQTLLQTTVLSIHDDKLSSLESLVHPDSQSRALRANLSSPSLTTTSNKRKNEVSEDSLLEQPLKYQAIQSSELSPLKMGAPIANPFAFFSTPNEPTPLTQNDGIKEKHYLAEEPTRNKIRSWRQQLHHKADNEQFGQKKQWVDYAMGEAKKIRNRLGDRYYVFTHGQMGVLLPIVLLNTYLMRLDPTINKTRYSMQKWMYHPNILPKALASEVFHAPDFSDGWEKYKQTESGKKLTANAYLQLLSADAYFDNQENGESASHYLQENRASTIGGNDDIVDEDRIEYVTNILHTLIDQYISDDYAPESQEKSFDADSEDNKCLHDILVNKFLEKIIEKFKLCKTSNLWIIAIPKEKINELGFLATPLGHPIAKWWNAPTEGIAILNRMQAGQLQGACNGIGPGNCQEKVQGACQVDHIQEQEDMLSFLGDDDSIQHGVQSFQMRLFTHKLNEAEVLSFCIPEMTKNKYSKLKDKIWYFANELISRRQEEQASVNTTSAPK